MKLRVLSLLCCLLVVYPSTVEGRVPQRTVALLIAECEASEAVCSTQHLVRYRFRDGEQVSRDIIFSAPTDRVRYDLESNHIYQNRYVITNSSDVVDVQTKQLLHNGIGEYIGADASRIIQRVERVDVEGFFYYDLKSNEFSRLERSSKWELPGLLSPDQTKSISVSEWGGDQIWLHTLNGRKKLLGSGFQVSVSAACCDRPRPPILWLDSNRILTQRSNGEILVLGINGMTKRLVKIPIKELPDTVPSLYMNAKGQIIYRCDEAYVLDVKNKKYSPYDMEPLGNGFEIERTLSPNSGQSIYFRDAEIGRWWSSRAETTNGFVALVYGDVGSNLGYPKGVKVWNNINNKWTTIDVKFLSAIIGWIEE